MGTTSLVDSATLNLSPGGGTGEWLAWHPERAGVHSLTTVVDGNGAIAETCETNNTLTCEVLVALDRQYVDCGAATDTAYSAAGGYGHLGGVPRVNWGSGVVSTAVETARYDVRGAVQYRFDHVDPYYPYQVDFSLYRGDSVTSSYELVVNGTTVPVYVGAAGAINQVRLDASNGFLAYATAYVPGSAITSNTVLASVRRADTAGPGYLSEIQLTHGTRFYIDCGAAEDLPFNPPTRSFGHLSDGYEWGPPDATPTTSVRYDFDGTVQYRFAGLSAQKSYILYATFWEDDGVGRVERLRIDGSVASDPVDMADGEAHTVAALVPSNAVADGQIDVTIERTDGADVQVSALELHEWTQGLLALRDMDQDGMPDAFEVAHRKGPVVGAALDPTQNDANIDTDGDGMSNFAEFLASTDPLDPSSKLCVLGMVSGQPVSGGLSITWQAAKFKHYRVDFCADVATREWQTVKEDLQAQTDGTLSWTDSDRQTPGTGFYRIVLLSDR
jgi:hypothetical protein